MATQNALVAVSNASVSDMNEFSRKFVLPCLISADDIIAFKHNS